MKPMSIEGSTGEGYSVIHQCISCGHKKKNKLADGKKGQDDMNVVFEIIKADVEAKLNASKKGKAK